MKKLLIFLLLNCSFVYASNYDQNKCAKNFLESNLQFINKVNNKNIKFVFQNIIYDESLEVNFIIEEKVNFDNFIVTVMDSNTNWKKSKFLTFFMDKETNVYFQKPNNFDDFFLILMDSNTNWCEF